MNDTKVLFIWKARSELQDHLRKGLESEGHITLVFPEEIEESQLLKHAPKADILVGWRPSKVLLDAAEQMKLFINPGAGVQHHIETFQEINKTRTVTLVNGHGNAYFTAQHGVALLLALANKVIPHHNWMVKGLWRRGDDYGSSTPLRGRKIGLLGYGAVNSKVHKLLSGFDVEFSILKRGWEGNEVLPTSATRYTPSQLHDFLHEVNTLIVAVPLTSKTRGMLALKELESLGADSLLVTTARGDVINEESLYTALSKRMIAGAAIDVWYEYKPEPDEEGRLYPFHYPFQELDNVILSPHRGMSPFADLERWNEVVENIRRFSMKRTDLLNIVDLDREY
ncbi:MAG: NAD(P)-dependent oxidoreductase [Candidatus Thorarchaeota archaeon]